MDQIDNDNENDLEKTLDLDQGDSNIEEDLIVNKEKTSSIKVTKVPDLDASEIIAVHHRSERVDPQNPITLNVPGNDKSGKKFNLPSLGSGIIEEVEEVEESSTRNINSKNVFSFGEIPSNKEINQSSNINVKIPQAYSPKTFNRITAEVKSKSVDKKKSTEDELANIPMPLLKKRSSELKKISLKDAKFEEFEKYDSNKNISIHVVHDKKNDPRLDPEFRNCDSPLFESQHSFNSGGYSSDPNMSIMSLRKEIIKSELKNFAKSQINITFPEGKANEVDVVFGEGSDALPITIKGRKGETQQELKQQIEVLIQANASKVDLNSSRDLSKMINTSSDKGSSRDRKLKHSIFKSRSKDRNKEEEVLDHKESVLGGLEEEEKEATPVALNVTPSGQGDEEIQGEEEDDQIQLIGKLIFFN